MYQSGTDTCFICWISASDSGFPFLTFSAMPNATAGSSPCFIRYRYMSSRVAITCSKVATPSLIRSLALLAHTSVPWDNPDILTRSAKHLGLVSVSMFLTNLVPNSGIPTVASGFSPENSLRVSGSSIGILVGSTPVSSRRILSTVGSSWPRISILTRCPDRES